MIFLSSQAYEYDNTAGGAPGDYLFNLDPTVTIPVAEWLTMGLVWVTTRIRISCSYSGFASIDQRFLNPTSHQIGHMAIQTDGFLVERHRIEALNHQIVVNHEPLPVVRSRATLPQRMALEQGGGHSHGINTSGVPICTSGEVLTAPPPAPSPLFASSEMPAGALCINTYPGAATYQTIDNFLPGAAHQIQYDRLEVDWFDSLSGVLYPGWFMGVTVDTYIQQVENAAFPEPLPDFVVGSPMPAIYSYTCNNGFAVASPTNPPCVPGALIAGNDNGLLCFSNVP